MTLMNRMTAVMTTVVLGLVFWAGMMTSAAAGEKSATMITREEIKGMNASSIQDVLNQLPGICAGGTSVSIRGSYMGRAVMACLLIFQAWVGSAAHAQVSVSKVKRHGVCCYIR